MQPGCLNEIRGFPSLPRDRFGNKKNANALRTEGMLKQAMRDCQ
jgi:hypothetical protein